MRWKTFSFYMPNALPEIVDLQRRAFASLGEPLQQVLDTCSHGEFLTRTMCGAIDHLDAVVFFDLDCVPLKPGVVEKAVRISLRRGMVIGSAQQANHLEVGKLIREREHWPVVLRKIDSVRVRICKLLGYQGFRLRDTLIYAAPSFLVVPTAIYKAVGQPTLLPTERTDVAGELTIACRERNVEVKCLRPTHCHHPKDKLGNKVCYGLGTTYGHCIFHAFETTYLSNRTSESLFRHRCNDIIRKYGTAHS